MEDTARLTPAALRIDPAAWSERIEGFLRDEFVASPRHGFVVPISGGLDSSVVASLCVRAIGPTRVLGLLLPERLGNPEASRHGRSIAEHLGIRTMTVDITRVLRGLGTANPFLAAISGREAWRRPVALALRWRRRTAHQLYVEGLRGETDARSRHLIAAVSSKQRARLAVTYRVAEERDLLVVGCANRTEQSVGLFVKYGIDDAADLMPLLHVHRSGILQLGEHLGIPAAILRRSPNPDILPGITDKYRGYFGLDHGTVDLILLGLDRGMPTAVIADHLGLDEATVLDMEEVVRLSAPARSHAKAPLLA